MILQVPYNQKNKGGETATPPSAQIVSALNKKRELQNSRSRRQVALARRILIVRTAHIVIGVLLHEVFELDFEHLTLRSEIL